MSAMVPGHLPTLSELPLLEMSYRNSILNNITVIIRQVYTVLCLNQLSIDVTFNRDKPWFISKSCFCLSASSRSRWAFSTLALSAALRLLCLAANLAL